MIRAGRRTQEPRSGRRLARPPARSTRVLLALAVTSTVLMAGLAPVAWPPRATAQAPAAAWSETAVAQPSRYSYRSATLAGGKVLVAQAAPGCGAGQYACFELYDPVEDRWLPVPPLANPTRLIIALEDGTALVTRNNSGSAAEPTMVFDPRGRTWSPVPSPYQRANGPSAALIRTDVGKCGDNCGKVLVTGGGNDSFNRNAFDDNLARSAELFDPLTRTLVPTGSIDPSRAGHFGGTAAQLADGRVLVAGGPTDQADFYDPATGTWSAAPDMPGGPSNKTFYWAVRLLDGRVLMGGPYTDQMVLFDPDYVDPSGVRTGRWLPVGDCSPQRTCDDATLLPDGTVLAVDRLSGKATFLFDPTTRQWGRTADPAVPLYGLSLLTGTAAQCGSRCGKVLGVGGEIDDLFGGATRSEGAAALYGDSTLPVRVTGLVPRAGFTCGGQSVTISGAGFAGATEVRFGDVSLPPGSFRVNADGTAIEVRSPRRLPGDVHVTVTARAGNASVTSATSPQAVYTYKQAEAATIASLSPALGPVTGGTGVALAGSFAPECVRSVTFGDVLAAGHSAGQADPGEFATTMTATSPAHDPGTVPLRVGVDPGPPHPEGTVVPSVAASPDADKFTFHPVVSGLYPPSGPTSGGNEVTIAGAGLATASEVRFGGDVARIVRSSAGEVVAIAPPHATPEVVAVKLVAGGVGALPEVTYTYELADALAPGGPAKPEPGAGPARQDSSPPEVAPPGGTGSPSPSPVNAPAPANAPAPGPAPANAPAPAPGPAPANAPAPGPAPANAPAPAPSPVQAPASGAAASPAQAAAQAPAQGTAPAGPAAAGAAPDEAPGASAAAARADSGGGSTSGEEASKGSTRHAMADAQVGLGLAGAGLSACFSWLALSGRLPSRRRRHEASLRPSRTY